MSGRAEVSARGRVQGQHGGGSRGEWQEENEVEFYRSIKKQHPSPTSCQLAVLATIITLLKLEQEHNGPQDVILMCMF